MKKYFKEIAILIAQLLMFYVFPLTAGPTDAIVDFLDGFDCEILHTSGHATAFMMLALWL